MPKQRHIKIFYRLYWCFRKMTPCPKWHDSVSRNGTTTKAGWKPAIRTAGFQPAYQGTATPFLNTLYGKELGNRPG